MCETCVDLTEKIDRCRRLLALVTDQLMIDAIAGLLRRYEAERASLHHDPLPRAHST